MIGMIGSITEVAVVVYCIVLVGGGRTRVGGEITCSEHWHPAINII